MAYLDVQSGETIVMRFVCPKDVKKMLLQRARSVYWKKWAAKHGYEKLKEGAWLEPGVALLPKTVKENWTEKHRNVARKIFLEGGWTQKRRSQTRDSRSFQGAGAKSKNVKEGMEVAKRCC